MKKMMKESRDLIVLSKCSKKYLQGRKKGFGWRISKFESFKGMSYSKKENNSNKNYNFSEKPYKRINNTEKKQKNIKIEFDLTPNI